MEVPRNQSPEATTWNNIYDSFLISQGEARLHENVMEEYARAFPKGFRAMYFEYSSNTEVTLAHIEKRLSATYNNNELHPGKVPADELRKRGVATLQAALWAGDCYSESPRLAPPGTFAWGIAKRIGDRDHHYLTRPERRNKPEGEYSLRKGNSTSHLFHYSFLDESDNYPADSIMHIALGAAAVFRARVEQQDFSLATPSISKVMGAFGVHLSAYPEHREVVPRKYLEHLDGR